MSLFNEFDMNGDGFINASELREGLRKRGISGNIGRMISDADEDGNARIDVEEFRKILSLHEDKTIEKKKKSVVDVRTVHVLTASVRNRTVLVVIRVLPL